MVTTSLLGTISRGLHSCSRPHHEAIDMGVENTDTDMTFSVDQDDDTQTHISTTQTIIDVPSLPQKAIDKILASASSEESENELTMGEADTKADNVVDSQSNPTQLFLRLNYRLWDMAESTLTKNPADAKVWIMSKTSSGKTKWKNLPLHHALLQSSNPPTVSIIEQLLRAYPNSIKCRNFEGNLPIHIACDNGALVCHGSETGPEIISVLYHAYPDSLNLLDNQGRLPLKILESRKSWTSDTIVDFIKSKTKNGKQNEIKPVIKPIEDDVSYLENISRHESEPKQNIIAEESPHLENRSPSDVIDMNAEQGRDIASELNRRSMMLASCKESPTIRKKELSYLSNNNQLYSPSKSEDPSSNSIRASSDITVDYRTLEANKIGVALGTSLHRSLHSFDKDRNRDYLQNNREMKLSKPLKENGILREKLGAITQENLALKTDLEEKVATIDDLRQCLDEERDFSQNRVKDLESQLTDMCDKLAHTEEKLALKARSEESLVHTIGALESSLSKRKDEMSRIRVALDHESSTNQTLQGDLGITERKVETLWAEITTKQKDMEDLMRRNEEAAKEMQQAKEATAKAASRASEFERTLGEREIQMRALTEAKLLSDKRVEKLEQSQESLRSKNSTLKDVIQKNTDSFNNNIRSLEDTIKKYTEEREELSKQLSVTLDTVEEKEKEIKELTDKKAVLTTTCDELRKNLSSRESEAQRNEELMKENKSLKARIDSISAADQKRKATLESKLSQAERNLEAVVHERNKLQVEYNNAKEDYDRECNDLNETVDRCTQKQEQLKVKNTELNNKNKIQMTLILDLEEITATLREENIELSEKVEQLDGCIRHLREGVGTKIQLARIADLEELVIGLRKENRELTREYDEMRETCNRHSEREKIFEAQRLEHESDKYQIARVADLEETIRALRSQHVDLIDEYDSATKTCKEYIQKIDNLETRQKSQLEHISVLEKTVGDLREKNEKENKLHKNTISELESTVRELESKNKDLSGHFTELEKSEKLVSDLEESISLLESNNDELILERDDLKKQIVDLKAQLKDCVEIAEEYDRQKKIRDEQDRKDGCVQAELNGKIKDMEVQLAAEELSRSDILYDYKILQEKYQKLDESYEELENIKGEEFKKSEQLKLQLEKLRDQLNRVSGEQNSKYADAQAQLRSLGENNKAIADQCNHLKKMSKEQEEKIVQLKIQLRDKESAMVESIKRYEAMQRDYHDSKKAHITKEEENGALQRELAICDEAKLAAIEKQTSLEQTIASYEETIFRLENELEIHEMKAQDENGLNKSYQIEVGRLLKEKAALEEQGGKLSDIIETKDAEIDSLKRCQNSFFNQSSESMDKIKNLLSGTLSDSTETEGLGKKDIITGKTEGIASEDAMANIANIQALVHNIVSLEETLSGLVTERNALKKTVEEQDHKIASFEQESKVGKCTLQSEVNGSYNGDWVEQRNRIKGLEEQLTKLKATSTKLVEYEEEVKVSTATTAAYKTMLAEVTKKNQALVLEKKVLITAGKEQSKKNDAQQLRLKDENAKLRNAVSQLSKQTLDLQSKIKEVAANQAALQQKKSTVLDGVTWGESGNSCNQKSPKNVSRQRSKSEDIKPVTGSGLPPRGNIKQNRKRSKSQDRATESRDDTTQ